MILLFFLLLENMQSIYGGKESMYISGNSIFMLFGHTFSLSEQLAHLAVDLHLKEIDEFLHGSELQLCCSKVTPQSAA